MYHQGFTTVFIRKIKRPVWGIQNATSRGRTNNIPKGYKIIAYYLNSLLLLLLLIVVVPLSMIMIMMIDNSYTINARAKTIQKQTDNIYRIGDRCLPL